MEHRGEIVRAQLLEPVDDIFYKFKARIYTGHEAGREGYVAYRGDPSSINGDILVRLQNPSKRSNLNFGDSVVTSNFVTSSIPVDFDFSSSEDTILFGIWETRMKQGFPVPIIEKIANFYNPGIMQRVLYYSNFNGSTVAYDVLIKHKPEISEHGPTGIKRDVLSALSRYLTRIGNTENPNDFPRQVMVDEEIDLEGIILPVFEEIIKSTHFSIVRTIQMEPQQ